MSERLISHTCISCGAPLKSNKCEYCGAEYGNKPLQAEFLNNSYKGEITVNGETFECYIGNIEFETICSPDSYRDAFGNMHLGRQITKRKITLIEM